MMVRIPEPELDELRKLNPVGDPRMFRRFLDHIDALEAELEIRRKSYEAMSASEFDMRKRVVALEAELAALTEKIECSHQRACWIAAEEVCSCGFKLREHQNYVGDKSQPSSCAHFKLVSRTEAHCAACADRDARVRLERAAALERGYTQGYADGEESYAFDLRGLDPDMNLLAEHDAALLAKYQELNHLLIGSDAHDFAEKFFHGHIDFVGSMQPAVKIESFISSLENAVQMFVDAYVQRKVAEARLQESEWFYFALRSCVPTAADEIMVARLESNRARAASPSGDSGGAP